MRAFILIGALALSNCSPAEPKREFSQQALDAALADPQRQSHREAGDARRKPGELIAFAGIKPGDKVLDLIPGDGYWTRIFSKIVGPEGKVYAVWPINYGRVALGNVETLRRLSADPYYGNIVTQVQPTTTLTTREPLDVVWTSQNYHDYPDEFMGKSDPLVLNNAVFQILNPGGTYIVIDHMAEAGSGMRDTERLHRIVAEGTIEDRIAELLLRKRELADAVLGSGEAALTELTDAELADLVALRGGPR